MNTASKYSKRQEQALIHWYQNLITVMTMDWDLWVSIGTYKRRALAQGSGKDIPLIYSEHCNYCQEFCSCTACPLYEDGTDCCVEWENVRDAVVREPDRDKAIEAIEALICHIQEAQ